MHQFHIPVMGTGFTIDTPVKVAPFGISSVISIVDDVLTEQMRKYYCAQTQRPYEEVTSDNKDSRALRITGYLNLVKDLVTEKFEALKASSLETDQNLQKYFDLLPEGPVRDLYLKYIKCQDQQERSQMETQLKSKMQMGSIDVNIMTKLNRQNFFKGEALPAEYNDALSALRGFANSEVEGSIIFSAGLNAALYGYMAQFKDFFPDIHGKLKKKIILKVSDYRSAFIQGKFLAKRGLWVSEYRIESGLNCGGHAFATQGYLLGPALNEFKNKRKELQETLYGVYKKASEKLGKEPLSNKEQPIRITVQGGVGDHKENSLLLNQYKMDGVGWGSPFLLVPEVTRVDQSHIEKLEKANKDQVHLSESSPLGIPFWNLAVSDSEIEKENRVSAQKPGSSCPKGFLKSNLEYTKKPICTASKGFQKLKLKELKNDSENIDEIQIQELETITLAKACICHDLAGGATKLLGIDNEARPAICCGPNVVNFHQSTTLTEMAHHIYGRTSLISLSPDRPHMFLAELELYVKYLKREVHKINIGLSQKTQEYTETFKENLFSGISYYKDICLSLPEMFNKEAFLGKLEQIKYQLQTDPELALISRASS